MTVLNGSRPVSAPALDLTPAKRAAARATARLYKWRRQVILTMSTLIGLFFLVLAAWMISAPFGAAATGVAVLLAGFYYETNSRPEDRG